MVNSDVGRLLVPVEKQLVAKKLFMKCRLICLAERQVQAWKLRLMTVKMHINFIFDFYLTQ